MRDSPASASAPAPASPRQRRKSDARVVRDNSNQVNQILRKGRALVTDIVEAFGTGVDQLASSDNNDGGNNGSSSSADLLELLSFCRFRRIWNDKGMTAKVLEVSGDPLLGMMHLQSIFLSAIDNLSEAEHRSKLPGWRQPRLGQAAFNGGRKRRYNSMQDKDELRILAKQIAGIYSVYLAYKIQSWEPRVRIYLPYPHTQDLLVVLWDARKLGLGDAHEIVRSLRQENAFVYGGLKTDQDLRPQVFLTRPNGKTKCTRSQKTMVDMAQTLVETGLAPLIEHFDQDRWQAYDKGLEKLTCRSGEAGRGEGLATGFMEQLQQMHEQATRTAVEAVDLSVGAVNATRGPDCGGDSGDGDDGLFGKHKTPSYEDNKAKQDVAKKVDQEEGEEDWSDFLNGLPAKWRRKIMQVLEAKKQNAIQKSSGGAKRKVMRTRAKVRPMQEANEKKRGPVARKSNRSSVTGKKTIAKAASENTTPPGDDAMMFENMPALSSPRRTQTRVARYRRSTSNKTEQDHPSSSFAEDDDYDKQVDQDKADILAEMLEAELEN